MEKGNHDEQSSPSIFIYFQNLKLRSYDFEMFLSILSYDSLMEATPCIFQKTFQVTHWDNF